MASIYKRDRYYWIKYYLHGKKIEYSLKVKDRKLAEHLKKKKEIEIEEGRTYPISQTSWDSFLTEYKTYCETTKTKNTNKRDYSVFNQFSHWAKIRKLKDLTPRHIRDYINHRIKEKKSCPAYNKQIHRCNKGPFKLCRNTSISN